MHVNIFGWLGLAGWARRDEWMPVNAQWLPRGGGAPQAVAAARLSCTARARAPPLPIVLHDGERAGVRGRCGRRWCGRSLRGGGPPQRPHTPRPLTLTLSPRREERRGERQRAPSATAASAPPLPIVLHDGERVGVRGRCEHRRCGRSFRSGGPAQSPHAPRPLTLTLSPRREERRGERGRATPPPRRTSRSAADLTPSAAR